jgi:hypothetical protein
MNTRETEREISVVENTRMRIHWFVERKREKVDLRREWRNGGGDDDEIEWNEREYIPFWRKRFFIFIYTKEGKCQIATLISSRTRNRLLSCGVVLVGHFYLLRGELLLPNVLLMQACLVFAISITSLYVEENNTFCICSLILICLIAHKHLFLA